MSTTKTQPKRNKDGKFTSKKHKASPSLLEMTEFHLMELPPAFKVRLAIIGQMKKYGFKNSELKALLSEMYQTVVNQQNTQGTFEAIARMSTPSTTKKDATQMVPISNVQASSLTPNFESVRSFFLTGGQKHPKFPDYIPAEEIGQKVGMTADNVKTFVKKYCNGLNSDLPNNDACSAVIRDGGFFKGMSLRLDEHNLPTLFNEKVGGIGCWYMMEDGHIVWRNYWSPEAVEEIISLIPEEKKFKIPFSKNPEQLNPFSRDPAITKITEEDAKILS